MDHGCRCLIMAAVASLSLAGAHARTWTSADGTKTFEGELVAYDAGKGRVTVSLSNGQSITFTQDKLSEADVAHLGENATEAAVAARQALVPLERIAIRRADDEARLVHAGSKRPFFVKGFNYVRLRAADGASAGDHATFDADTQTTKAHYDPGQAEAMFGALSQAGYNTVRVFIIGRSKVNPGIAGDFGTTEALYEPYMENVLDFLRRATRHGIRVFPTFSDGGIPLNAYYRHRNIHGNGFNHNALILTKEGIDARVEHVASFLSYVKEKEPRLLPTLLGLQCQNEAYLRADHWPFTMKEGEFTAANGRTYDMASTDQRQALMDEGYLHYHERMVAAVKAIDPEMLVAEGVFVPRAVGKDPAVHAGVWPGKTKDERYPPTLTSLGTGPLDFLDVHFYRTDRNESVDEAFRLNLASTGFFTRDMAGILRRKPVIMGEFGAFDHVEETFEEAVGSMVRVRDLALDAGVSGMLFWTYDCFEQPRLYHAATDWPLFVREMGDFGKPGDGVLVGVNYFAGWWKELPNKWHGQGWNIDQPDWRPVFPERVPLLGQYNDQATMDREIVAAASHGVDFFAILWYYPKPGGRETEHAPRLNRGLETFLASPEAGKMRFCIEYCNSPNFSAEGYEQWAACITPWVEAMKHPSYLRIDGRLVFKVHGITEFLRANNNDLELCRQRLDTLRAAVRDAGLGEMIIGVGISGQTPPLGAKWPPAKLFDFTGTYMCVPEVEEREAEHPYATLAAQARTTLGNRVNDPLPWMPYLAAGWNPRPWHYPQAAPHYQRFFSFPTRDEFTAELRAMKISLEEHPSLGLPKKDGTMRKAFTIYAWNEFGEGGIVAPTEGRKTMMLEAIQDVFGENQ